jgi:hypothetical protein
MSQTDGTAAEQYAATVADELRLWRDAIGNWDGHAYRTITAEITPADGDGESLSWGDYLDACALDVEVLRSDDRNRLRVEVLRTYGGPGCRIVYDDQNGNYFTVTAYTMGDPTARVDVYCPEFAQWLEEMYG